MCALIPTALPPQLQQGVHSEKCCFYGYCLPECCRLKSFWAGRVNALMSTWNPISDTSIFRLLKIMFTFYFMLIVLYLWVNYPGILLDQMQSLGHREILGKDFIVSYNQVCLKSRNIPVRYKIYRDIWFINFNLLILQESLAYNFVSTSGSWGLKISWLVSLKDEPWYRTTFIFLLSGVLLF